MASNIKLKNNLGSTFTLEHTNDIGDVSLTSTQLKNIRQVDTIADLRAMTDTQNTVWVSGYHTKDDGAFGSHFFRWNPTSTEDDNGGTIIKLDSVATGRYELQYNGAVNVKWFGAKGDNYTLNDTVFGTISSLAFGNIYFPSGTYISNTRLEINSVDNVNIYGDNAILKSTTSLNSPVYHASNGGFISVLDPVKCTISNLSFEMYGNKSSTFDAYEKAISVRSNSSMNVNTIISGCKVKGSNGEAIYFSGLAENVIMENNFIEDSVGAVANINKGGDAYAIVSNNIIKDVYDAINVTGSNIICTNNIINGVYNSEGSGIVTGDTGATTNNILIANNIIKNKQTSTSSLICGGIYISYGTPDKVIIQGNMIEDFAPIGINSRGNTCTISNNQISELGATSATNSIGINIEDGGKFNTVDNNHIKSTGSYMKNGITAGYKSTTIPNTTVSNNYISGVQNYAYGNIDYFIVKNALGETNSYTTPVGASNYISKVQVGTTITLDNYDNWFSSATTTVATITDSYAGAIKTITNVNGTLTLTYSSSLRLSGSVDYAMASGKSITFVFQQNGIWRELYRS